MGRWVDGWLDGWMGRWMDGWMADGSMDVSVSFVLLLFFCCCSAVTSPTWKFIFFPPKTQSQTLYLIKSVELKRRLETFVVRGPGFFSLVTKEELSRTRLVMTRIHQCNGRCRFTLCPQDVGMRSFIKLFQPEFQTVSADVRQSWPTTFCS